MPSLTTMPPALSRLSAHHLNRLVQFARRAPRALRAQKLRNLEAAGNQIAALPAGVGMATLQTVDLSNNALADPAAKELTALVSLKLNSNKLTALPLAWRSSSTSARSRRRAICRAPAGPRRRQMLVLARPLGEQDRADPDRAGQPDAEEAADGAPPRQPARRPAIRRFVENDEPSLVKDLLNHVKKNGYKATAAAAAAAARARGRRKKKGKAAKEEEPEDDEDTDANIADLRRRDGRGWERRGLSESVHVCP